MLLICFYLFCKAFVLFISLFLLEEPSLEMLLLFCDIWSSFFPESNVIVLSLPTFKFESLAFVFAISWFMSSPTSGDWDRTLFVSAFCFSIFQMRGINGLIRFLRIIYTYSLFGGSLARCLKILIFFFNQEVSIHLWDLSFVESVTFDIKTNIL